MPRPVRLPVLVLGSALLVGLGTAPGAAQQPLDAEAVDAVFAAHARTHGPGCAVGVSRDGRPLLQRAYGVAELEHGVVNAPDTRFEAGSVSKQFTAAAVVLLALEGALSLDDDVREWFPELPDYGETVTVRRLLNHTSGLRDWGSVAAIEGWPRTTRVHTHEQVLDILARQRALNYPPGRWYSYTNSGYNLLAMLVERASGVPFADFSRRRLFEPLGLDHTEWRDDFTRVVPDRAQAYEPDGSGGYRLDMPFENVHGNGGLITTVGDLLTWTENLETGALGGPRFLEEMHRQGVLTDGRVIPYASGLVVSERRGVPMVAHSGSTAGYRAYLARYPEQRLAVAVLCNAADANATALAHATADLALGDALDPVTEPTPATVAPDALARLAGVYRNTRTDEGVRVAVRDGRLTVDGRPVVSLSPTRFRAGSAELVFETDGAGRPAFTWVAGDGDRVRFEPVATFAPSPAELAAFVGTYRSDEAEADYTFEVRDGRLFVRGRWGEAAPLEPLYPDVFEGRGATWRFVRGPEGAVTAVRQGSSRVWDLRLERVR